MNLRRREVVIENIARADGMKNYTFVLGSYDDPNAEGEGVRLLKEAKDPNLYFSVILQVENEAHYQLLKDDLQAKIRAMDPQIRRRFYVFMVLLEDKRLIKPFTHYKLQRWLMEGDPDYRMVDPNYNTEDPGTDMTLPFKDILGGDPTDTNDLRNIREGNIASSSDPLQRKNKIRYTLVYDPGNVVEYEDLKKLVSVMAHPDNEEIMYIGKMRYIDEDATFYTNIMKYFPQEMLRYAQEAMFIVFRSLRAPGKYAYRNDDYYREIIKTYAYEKIWPFGDRKTVKSEDEINTIGCGRVRYIPDVVIKKDPILIASL